MQPVDSQVLQRVAKVLQLATPGAQQTDFQDDQLQQVIDVAPIIRRGGAPFGLSAVFVLTLQNVHAGAGSLTATRDVYQLIRDSVGQSTALDVWMFGAHLFSSTTTAHAAQPVIRAAVTQPPIFSGIALTSSIILQRYGTAKVLLANGANDMDPQLPWRAIRIPRNGVLEFITNAAAAETITAFTYIGIFPESLGQDAVGA